MDKVDYMHMWYALKSLSTFFILGCFFVLVTGSHNVVQVNLVYSALLKLLPQEPPKCWD